MKKKNIIIVIVFLLVTIGSFAQEKKITEIKLSCDIECQKCANKIKHQLAFTKGVKYIETNIEKQTVTIKYRTNKTDKNKILKSLQEIGYKAVIIPKEQEKEDLKKN